MKRKPKPRTPEQLDTRYTIQQQVRLGWGASLLSGVAALLAILFMLSL